MAAGIGAQPGFGVGVTDGVGVTTGVGNTPGVGVTVGIPVGEVPAPGDDGTVGTELPPEVVRTSCGLCAPSDEEKSAPFVPLLAR